jgi:hypothetical protein
VPEVSAVLRTIFSAENVSVLVYGDFDGMTERDILEPWSKLAALLRPPDAEVR